MEAAGNMATQEFDGAQSNVVSSSQSTTEQGKNTDSLSECSRSWRKRGRGARGMEAAGNMITKEFDGGGALTRVAGLQQSGDPQHLDTQEELEKDADRMETKIMTAS